ncbi:MAG: NmrA/HSCARG family protein [Actinomycetota bacterium]|nr:NmrA/HSCARG family protein [Actinomycetota bacterium]
MSEQTVVAVVGATGQQGGGLARAILDDPAGRYTCRALTRNPASQAARALADRGAEVVAADLDDEDSLVRGFEGAYGAYCMTNFFEHFSPQREQQQAANLARAAKAAGIRHAIWSTNEDSREWLELHDRLPVLEGGYRVPHWDAKAEANRFFTDNGVPTTFLRLPMFWENFGTPGTPQYPQRDHDGVLAITLPAGDAKLPGLAAADIGGCARSVFRAGHEFVGKTVGLAAQHLTGQELAEGLSELQGETVRYNSIPLGALRSAPMPGADAVANMFQIITEGNDKYCAHYDPGVTRSLNPQLQTFAAWITAAKDQKSVPAGTRGDVAR